MGFLHVIVEKSIYRLNPNMSDHKINIITTLTFLSFSFAAVLGGHLSGKFIDKYKCPLTKYGAILINILRIELTLVLIVLNENIYAICLVISILNGYISSSANTTFNVLISNYFKGSKELFCLGNLAWSVLYITMLLI